MSFYRKLPVEIEARQWDGTEDVELRKWIGDSFHCFLPLDNKLAIKTLEGVITASVGDYIIKGIKGEFYPCQEQIFLDSYEFVRDGIIRKALTEEEVLNLSISDPRTDEVLTVRKFLKYILCALWSEKEGFSGKRPLGDSDWEWPIYNALFDAGAILGKRDQWGGLESCEYSLADEIIEQCIEWIFREQS